MDYLLPLCTFAASTAANARLLALWGLGGGGGGGTSGAGGGRGGGGGGALSVLLLALLLAPHVVAASFELLRSAAAAALPASLRAASGAAPPERMAAALCGAVLAAPAWVAWPCLLLLMAPCLALLTVLLPLTLPLHLVGLASDGAARRYVELLQACSAATLSLGSAVLLSALLLAGNTPATGGALLTPGLFWVALLADFSDAWVGLSGALRRAREAAALGRLQQHPQHAQHAASRGPAC